MPLIPETWLESQIVNTTTSGQQSQPDITQLANGNILVTWTSGHVTGDGSPTGTEVFAQLYDPLGTPIGTEFRINASSTVDNESDSDIVALPDGGFLVIYHDDDLDGLGGGDIRLERFDATGTGAAEDALVVTDAGTPAQPNYANPRGACSSATSVMIVYDQIGGASPGIYGKIYNPTTNTYGAEFLVLPSLTSQNADIAVLSNGNYVVAGEVDAADNGIGYRIFDAAGGQVAGAFFVTGTDSDGFDDTDVSVTALTGGGFVLVWTQTDASDTDVMYRVYNNLGVEQSDGIIDGPANTDDHNEPVVIGLDDGTFVVFFDNESGAALTASHRSATGAALGSFDLDANAYSISAVALEDGRMAITYMLDPGDDIRMEILDTRDVVNVTPVYPGDWQIGTVGDDVFSSTGSADTVHGWAGNDTITEGLGSTTFFGDDGDDSFNITSSIATDGFFGGDGQDTIDWSASAQLNGIFDLQAGTATIGATTEQMVGFEDILGTASNDTILGTSASNTFSGEAGNDTLNGRGGADNMAGGAGNDLFVVDNLGDVLDEIAGGGTADRVVASTTYVLAAGVEVERMTTDSIVGVTAINLTGNALAQLINGNAGANVLSAGAAGAADRLVGYGGNDTYRVFNAGDIIVEGAGGGTGDRVITTVTFTLAADDDIEFLNTSSAAGLTVINLTGNALSQVIIGNAAGNIISGGAAGGADTLNGQLGNDIYRVFNAGDIIIEGVGNGTADRVNAATSFNLAVDDNIEILSTHSSAGVGAINLRGNGLHQSLFGNAGANRLNGGGGSDTITGAAGADVFIFQAALGATNIDRITDYTVAADQIEIDNSAFVGLALGALAGAAFTSNATGTATLGSHRIIYETDTGFLWFDADGNGAVARIQFADLAGGLAMLATEFTVV